MYKIIKKVLCILLLPSLLGCSQVAENTPIPPPIVTPIPGWQKLSIDGFQMELPESYITGTSFDFESIEDSMRKSGLEFEDDTDTLNQSGETLVAFAVDKRAGKSGVGTNIVIGKNSWPSDESVKSYMEGFIDNLPDQFQVIHSEIFSDRTYPMFQLITGINTPQTGNVKQVVYGIKNGGAIWQIVFTTSGDEYETRSAEFEQMVETIVIPFSEDELNSSNDKSISFAIGVILIVTGLILNYLNQKRKNKKNNNADANGS